MPNDPDLLFAIGLVVGFLAFPALLSAFSQSRPPRSAMMMIVISGGLIMAAVLQKPTGYSVEQAPMVFSEVMGRYLQ